MSPRRKAAGGERLQPPKDGVAVRMYRQGLGDCFLFAFPRSGEPFYLLIDCGVILGTEDARAKMTAVANSIAAATGGRLDLLVATHEHWDHLSGFVQAKAVFEDFAVEETWLAWTEDLKDPLANELRKQRHTAVAALVGAVTRLAAAGSAAQAQRVRNVLDFFGDALSLGATTTDALDVLRQRENLRFRRPGEGPLSLPGVEGVRIYVLGPPIDQKLIKKANPSKRQSEVYEPGFAFSLESAFYAAAYLGKEDPEEEEKLGVEERELLRLSRPFDDCYRIPMRAAKSDPFFRKHYGFDKENREDWRRIDDDWLGATGELALKLDSATNNTSLALAIELLPSRRVLLFPADAQVGNWLSWDALSWPGEDGGAALTAAELLRRTVLYKVGHHASHNATMREKGLERMESTELVAMIPVDEKQAREKKKWDMPFPPLLARLEEKTRGRILRADLGLPERRVSWKPFKASATDLYVELVVPR